MAGRGGGLAKCLQYYIGVGQQMVTVLHRGGLANDPVYHEFWVIITVR